MIPVYNEVGVLAASVERLERFLDSDFPFTWRITVVDNASTDGTWTEATKLAALDQRVSAIHLDQKGRGRALRAAWLLSDAPVVAYMDVDLSTDLRALLPLIGPLVSGHSDVAIGSRLAAGARVERGARREFISRSYNRLLRVVFRAQFRDAQCGFKALRADVARKLLPEVADEAWFFDTELLLLAERNGLRINEVPVDWVDDPDSRVRIAQTAIDDLKGMSRMAIKFWGGGGIVALGEDRREPVAPGTGGELITFAAVGIASTVVYFAVFLVLSRWAGLYLANAVALTATMIANIGVHRRWTFGRRGQEGRRREWTRATAVHLAGLALTSAAIALAVAIDGATFPTLVLLLLSASAVATAGRFLLMPAWVFRKATR